MAELRPPQVSFATPFDEQIAFFKQKLNLPSEWWDDIMVRAHDRAFMVAGAEKADLLQDLRGAVAKSLSGQITLDGFHKEFKAIVARNGWTGWTGEGTKGGEAWRANIIYQTNMASSYAAGRWKQLTDPELLKLRPYWRYHHADGVLNPRQQHVAWNGLVLPHDHPFWKTHYPPNGFGCHCWVSAASQADYEAAQARGQGEPPAGWDKPSEIDGLLPGLGRGWDYAPGASWHPDLDKYPAGLARQIVSENMADGVFDRWQARIARQVEEALPQPEYVGLNKGQTVAMLRSELSRKEEYPVAVMDEAMRSLLGVQTQVVKFSDWDAIKQAYSRRGDPNFTLDAYRAVQGILDNVELIVREGAQPTVWFRDSGGKLYVAVLWQTDTGKGLFLKSLRFGGERDMRRSKTVGTVLYEK
jgi:hypothetical protein